MNTNELVTMSLGIELTLNGLDIGLIAAVTLHTFTCNDINILNFHIYLAIHYMIQMPKIMIPS